MSAHLRQCGELQVIDCRGRGRGRRRGRPAPVIAGSRPFGGCAGVGRSGTSCARVRDWEGDRDSYRQLLGHILRFEEPKPDDAFCTWHRLRRPPALRTGNQVPRRGPGEPQPAARTAGIDHDRPLSRQGTPHECRRISAKRSVLQPSPTASLPFCCPESEKSWAHRAT